MQHRFDFSKCLCLCTVAVVALAGCSATGSQQIEQKQVAAAATVNPELKDIVDLATAHEKQLDDGWFFGEYPRIFKSDYAGVTPRLKAQFAYDYMNTLHQWHEDLVADWSSYVPYTTRANYAANWWRAHDPDGLFAKQNLKMNIVWIHESLMDASELWWRAFEDKNGANIPTPRALAHDEEQRKVFDYLDHEGQPRSLSDLVAAAHAQPVH